MDFSKAMRLGSAGVLLCAGAVLGTVLQAVLRLGFFDLDTGFYTDGGVAAWLGLLLPLAAGGLAVWLCVKHKGRLGGWAAGRRPVAGALAAASGGVLLWAGAVLAADYAGYAKTGLSRYESAGQWVHIAFFAMCLLFGVAQLVLAGGLFSGRMLLVRWPLLYLPAALWGAAYMVLTYVFYAKSSAVVENLHTMGGAAALFLGLLYLCRLLAGVDAPGAGLWMAITGGVAVLLGAPYQAADLVLRLTGRAYAGEMPVELQLCGLAVALFMLAVIVGYLQGCGEDAAG